MAKKVLTEKLNNLLAERGVSPLSDEGQSLIKAFYAGAFAEAGKDLPEYLVATKTSTPSRRRLAAAPCNRMHEFMELKKRSYRADYIQGALWRKRLVDGSKAPVTAVMPATNTEELPEKMWNQDEPYELGSV